MRLAKETAGAIGLLLLGAGLMAPLWISMAAANSSHRHGFRSGAATCAKPPCLATVLRISRVCGRRR